MVEEEKLDYSYQTKITNPELYKNGLTPYPVVETLDAWLTDEVSKVKKIVQCDGFLKHIFIVKKCEQLMLIIALSLLLLMELL